MPRLRYSKGGSSGGGGGDVTSVSESGSTPLTISPTTGDVLITISQADTSTDGYLSSTDWNTFNNKADANKIGDANTYVEVDTVNQNIKMFVGGVQVAQWG